MRIYKELIFKTDNHGNLIVCDGEKFLYQVTAPDKDVDDFFNDLLNSKELFEKSNESYLFEKECGNYSITVVKNKTNCLLVTIHDRGDVQFDEIFENWYHGACCVKYMREAKSSVERDWVKMKENVT